MKKLVVIVLLALLASINAQSKYMIYFKDKGALSKKTLLESSEKNKIALEILSKKSIERRKKNLGDEYFTYEDLPISNNYLEDLKKRGVIIINRLKWFNAVTAKLNEKQYSDLLSLNYISKIDHVKKMKRSRPIKSISDSGTNTLKKSTAYNLDYGTSLSQNEISEIPSVHDMGINGEGVIVGVLDSGFDWNDAESINNANVIAEYDFVKNDNVTEDQTQYEINDNHDFHGTAVLSILGGFSSGNLIGPAFNSEFVLAKTEWDSLGSENHAEEDNYAAALEWMDSIGVDVTNTSLGYSTFDPPENSYSYADMDGQTTIVTKASELAFERGIALITSAGNEGDDPWFYITAPGDGFNTITVGAVTSSNNLAFFSSRGPTSDGRIKPEVVAQGVTVYHESPISKTRYRSGNGTSYSAPITAGIAAQLLSAHKHLTNKQIRSILLESGDNSNNPNNQIGYGLVSALRAVTYPNFEKIGDQFILHKLFQDNGQIDDSSVELVFKDGSKYSMTRNNSVFNVNLPTLNQSESYEFYISYKDMQGNLLRVPATRNYKFKYGQLNIDLVLTNIDDGNSLPKQFDLSQNYPNPFNPTTTIEYSIPFGEPTSNVVLKIFDILGNEVKTLVNEKKGAGKHSIEFSSNGFSSGMYFYQIQIGKFTKTKKLTILK